MTNFVVIMGEAFSMAGLENVNASVKYCSSVELCDDDDFIVLACDGIWDCMSSQQLVDFIHEQLKSESKLSAVCERVLDRCLAPSTAGGEGCDNMTMILVQFEKPLQSGPSLVEGLPASSEKLPAPSEANTETKAAECGSSS
ncbi:hypothetical protein HAX54_019965 [Datura stramonium]|uniref:PPM-type phosphatase domain-containing protein n=1 Tax=Datura stramonium TaxID=4076 RepID=A0ABS8UQ35_DATST|nr:hypothetical protein [Datura stramonium]